MAAQLLATQLLNQEISTELNGEKQKPVQTKISADR